MPIPVPHGSKDPGRKKWQDDRVTVDNVAERFNGKPMNMGGLWGAPSGNVVDIDLDCEEAVIAWEHFAPPTGLIWGRDGNPKSHYAYRVRSEIKTAKRFDPTRKGKGADAMVMELRSTGTQSILPPSVHPDGPLYVLEAESGPSEIDADELMRRFDMATAAALLGRYWPEGGRHDMALALGGGLASADVPIKDAVAIQTLVCRIASDEQLEDRLTAIRNSYDKAGEDGPLASWAAMREAMPRVVVDRVRDLLVGRQSRAQKSVGLRTTELGNAERLVEQYGGTLRWAYQNKEWRQWDGFRRVDADAAEVGQSAIEVVRGIYREAADPKWSRDQSKALADWAAQSETNRQLEAMVAIARKLEGVGIRVERFDADDWLFNTRSGPVDLRTGLLLTHAPEHLLTKMAEVEYDPEATCPRWESWIFQAMRDRTTMVDYVQELMGLFLTGSNDHKIFPIVHGEADSGKTVFTNTLHNLMGDYSAVATERMLATSGDKSGIRTDVPNDVAALVGKRLVIFSETSRHLHINSAFVKAITGRSPITARYLHKEWFTFRPQFNLIIETNYKPNIDGTDRAMWNRVKLIPFEVVIPEAQQDPTLEATFKRELPGILAWAIRGLHRVVERGGLVTPDTVVTATRIYHEESDSLGRFIKESCNTTPGVRTLSTSLYQDYRTWMTERGMIPTGDQPFSRELRKRGFVKVKVKGTPMWKGIEAVPASASTLTNSPADEEEEVVE